MKLSTHEFAKAIAESLKGETSKRITIEDIKIVLNRIPAVVLEAILAGDEIRWHGFADFFGVVKEAGEGVNPATGEKIDLDERLQAKAKLSRTWKEKVKKKYAETK